jgi:hypothetical protein
LRKQNAVACGGRFRAIYIPWLWLPPRAYRHP